ncbi:uncharacterized protein [Brachyistius frenatus]|uniref:uncharacterized protein n=1 Tax=Brachyistius frenatus TaxID=100188 RepID=UPI0037E99CE2
MHSCPVCLKIYTALSEHLQNIHAVENLKGKRVPSRRDTPRRLMADLRTTDPRPGMKTTLNQDQHDHQPPETSPVLQCDNQDCRQLMKRLSSDVKKVTARMDRLLEETSVLHVQLRDNFFECRSCRSGIRTPQQPVEEDDQREEIVESVGPFSQQWTAAPSSAEKLKRKPSALKQFAPWSTGRGRGNRMRLIKLPRSMEEYLTFYKAFHEGYNPTRKMTENAVSKVSRLKSFLLYMGHERSRLSDWLFLDDMLRTRGWIKCVLMGGMKVTTVAFYLKNILNFVNYMRETPPRYSRLNQRQMSSIVRELQMGLKSLRREVVVHQMATKRSKVRNLPSKRVLMICLTASRKRIPELLDILEEDHIPVHRFLFYGYLTAYWSCLFGHRPGVFTNLTDTEVVEAKRHGGQQGYLLHIKEHKTSKTFGEAQMYLTPAEFRWLERWLSIKGRVKKGQRNKFLLFTKGKGPCKHLNTYLRNAWQEMGLQGDINFTLIRTTLASYAKKTQTVEARKKISDFMCHDVRTADRFYTINPDHREARNIRKIILDSISQGEDSGDLSEAAGRSRVRTTSKKLTESSESSNDEQVPYQDSGEEEEEEEEEEENKGQIGKRRKEQDEDAELQRKHSCMLRSCKVVLIPIKSPDTKRVMKKK